MNTNVGFSTQKVVFVAGLRTPFGKSGENGLYAETRSDDLIVKCVKEILRRNPQIPTKNIDEVAIAATTQTGDQGLTIGRSVALLAGLPQSVPGFAIDRMCAGAMTAVTTTASGIAVGAYEIVVAGGVEHMGNHPMGSNIDPNPRFLSEKIVNSDALVMGKTAENIHDNFPHITKERADKYALNSQIKLAKAYKENKIQPDLVPIATKSTANGYGLATQDQPPRPDTNYASLQSLRTPFRVAGKVTAGNSAGLNDGAAVSLLASENAAQKFSLPVQMRLVAYAFAGVSPEIMGIGPIPATEKVLTKAGLKIEDIGLFEINEAFAVQVLAFLDHFGIADDDARVNLYGGAIAVGHPLAASGVRLMTQLARQFSENPQVRFGLTTMCVGLGMGGSVIWENPYHKDYCKFDNSKNV